MQDGEPIFPTELEKKYYYIIRNEINNGSSIDSIISNIKHISGKYNHPLTVYIYTALHLLKSSRPRDGSNILSIWQKHAFVNSLLEKLFSKNGIKLTKRVWSEALLSDLWAKTRIARQQSKMVGDIINDTISGKFIDKIQSVVLVDLGCGTGTFMAQVLKIILPFMSGIKVKLVCVDEEDEMLKSCKNNYAKNNRFDIDVQAINMSVNARDIRQLLDSHSKNTIIVNSASMMHELNKIEAVDVMSQILNVADAFFLTEIEGNHDVVDTRNEELLHSATIFYDCLSENASHDNIGNDLQMTLIKRVFVEEFIGIVCNDYANRKNYHRPHQLWEEMVTRVNGKINNFMNYKIEPHGIKSLCYSIGKN